MTFGVRALTLSHFRTYGQLALDISTPGVILTGPNGAGKTNLLEAISLLAPGRGLRRAATPRLARLVEGAPSGAWAVGARLDVGDGQTQIGIGQDGPGSNRRLVRRDGSNIAQQALADVCRLSWLTPAQDRVFVGSRGDRLRYFDRLALAIAPDHGRHWLRYEEAMRQRARVLEQGGDSAWLTALEVQMAEAGAPLLQNRFRLVAAMQEAMDARPESAFPRGVLAIEEAGGSPGASADSDVIGLEGALIDALKSARGRDARAGRCLVGPHRSDIVVSHRAKNMPASECSTGEQKALLVGLALAHATMVRQNAPDAATLVLFDEAVAHLDRHRRAALAAELVALDAQSWLTGTDASLFEDFPGQFARFQVREGSVVVPVEGLSG